VKKLLAILAAFGLLGATSAYAADNLPSVITKAPAIPTAYPYQSSGLFFGLYTEGGAGSVSATAPGVNPASLTTTDAGLGVTVGYAFGQKGSQFAYTTEADFGVTNFNGNNAGFALQGPLAFEQRFVVWTPFSNLQSLLPNFPNIFGTVPPFPALQPNVTASNLQTGLAFGVREEDVSLSFAGLTANKEWLVEPVIKLMAMEQLSNGTALRAWAGVAIPTQGHFIGPVPGSTATQGPKALVGVGAYF
jgi:hypothetical protein